MKSHVKSIEIKCPICQAVNKIDVPEAILAQKKFGTIKIQIPMGVVCSEHQFIIFVDQEGIIRGYEKIDLEMQISTEESAKEKSGVIRLQDLIKIFGTIGLLSLIHSKVFGYPCFIIVDEELGISEDLLNLIGDKLLTDEYQGFKTIHFLQESDFGGKLDQINIGRDTFLMDTHQRIFQTPWDASLKWEGKMVKKALEIIDKDEQFFILYYEISKFIKEANEAKNILEVTEEIREKDFKKKLILRANTPKISNLRFSLIKEFIERRFSPNLIYKIK
ncbi:MAG: hypothetical protein ACFFDK_12480 [Promethearchaeota archaeon]